MSNSSFGVVVFSSELSSKSVQEVKLAANQAGIPENYVYEIKPRNSFIRSMRQLKKDGVIRTENHEILSHKFNDDETRIDFQFSRCFVEAQGVRYDPAAVLSFDKSTHIITCVQPDLLRIAQDLYTKLQGTYSVQDLNILVKRYVKHEGARQVLLRDGVYFLPELFKNVAENIQKFYGILGFTFFVLPVLDGSEERVNLVKAVVSDITKTVKLYQEEIQELKIGNNLTPRIANNRIKELQKDLADYKLLAGALHEDVANLLTQAGDAGEILNQVGQENLDTLISSIQRGGKSAGLVFELCEAVQEREMEEAGSLQVDI